MSVPGCSVRPDRVADPRRIHPIAGAIRIELEDGGAPAILARVVVRLRSDRDVHLRAGAIEDDVARGVAADGQVEQLLRLALRLQVAVRVLEAHERAGVADVEISVVERHAERRGERAGPAVVERRRRRARRRGRAEDRAVDRGVDSRRGAGALARRQAPAGAPAPPPRRAATSPWAYTLRASNTPSLFASRSTVMLLAAGELTNRSPFGA